MKPTDLATLLREFHHDKLALRQRHAAVAKFVTVYEANNTYQYVIAREDVHLAWLEAAIAELAGTPDVVAEPVLAARGKKDSFIPLVDEDAREAAAFVARWRSREADVTNARHRGLIHVILGESLEHKRFFDQIAAGRADVLGRRSNGGGQEGTGDGVMGVRWVGTS